MRILIVKLGSIGDIVHTLPSLAAIRRAFAGREGLSVSWVAERRSAEILRGNDLIDELVEVDTRAFRGGSVIEKMALEAGRQLKTLRVSEYDVALDFQGLLKSAAIARLARVGRVCGFGKDSLREPMARFLLGETFAVPEGIHVIRKNLALAHAALGIDVPDADFEFPIGTAPEHVAEAESIASRAGGDFALLNPAGGWPTKLWPAERFGALADRLWTDFGLVPLVVTAPAEKELADQVAASSSSGKLVRAEPSLKGFLELARRAKVYVGGDTGPTHLAVAAKAPVVGIFGPTEWWRNGSPDPRDICVERTDIGCRVDCHRRACGNWICLDIEVERVLEAISERVFSS